MDILEQLRTAKQQKGLSCEDIVRLTELNGYALSYSTVKRFFHSDSRNFRSTTITALSNVLLAPGIDIRDDIRKLKIIIDSLWLRLEY